MWLSLGGDSDSCLFSEEVWVLVQAGRFHSFWLSYNNTYCAPGSFGLLLHFYSSAACTFFLHFFFSPSPGHKVRVVHLDPLWPAFLSRVSGLTAFILIAPDKRFPWHTISPSFPLLSFSSTCLSILTTQASRLSLAWLNWWSKGTEQNNLQTFFFFFSGRQKQGERRRRRAIKRGEILRSQIKDVLRLLRDSLIILHFQQKQWWERNISYLSKWQFAHLMPVLCGPDILSSTVFALM